MLPHFPNHKGDWDSKAKTKKNEKMNRNKGWPCTVLSAQYLNNECSYYSNHIGWNLFLQRVYTYTCLEVKGLKSLILDPQMFRCLWVLNISRRCFTSHFFVNLSSLLTSYCVVFVSVLFIQVFLSPVFLFCLLVCCSCSHEVTNQLLWEWWQIQLDKDVGLYLGLNNSSGQSRHLTLRIRAFKPEIVLV